MATKAATKATGQKAKAFKIKGCRVKTCY